jgi:hypothetical protein
MKHSLLLFILVSCAQTPTRALERYEVMDNLWKKKASRSEIVKTFGAPTNEEKTGIAYIPNHKRSSIVSAHFFNQDNMLDEQLILVQNDELQKLKLDLNCPWDIQEKVISTSHTVRTVETGRCPSRNISYEFLPTSGVYEVRWK